MTTQVDTMELDLQGWLFEQEQRWLYELAYRLPDHSIIVEIGSWKGLSTSNICKGCVNTSKKIFAIDTWQGTPGELNSYYAEAINRNIHQVFLNNMKILGYSDLIKPIKGQSVDVARNFQKKIDFLFIDGDHSEEAVKRDIESWLPHCKVTAIIAGHDYAHWAPGVIKAVNDEFRLSRNPVESIWQTSPRYCKAYRKITDALNKSSDSGIKFTFIIMSYNFSNRLKICLESLSLQSYPKIQFEIIIANPQSSDDIQTVIKHCQSKFPELLLKIINFAPTVGIDRGRIYNELAWQAQGETLCLMDADAVLPEGALQYLDEAVARDPKIYHSCFRRDVPIEIVNRFLSGELNIQSHFHILSSAAKPTHLSSWSAFCGKIGFFQIVDRDTFLEVNYEEGVHSVAQTDIKFADRYIQYVGDNRPDYRIPGLEIFHLDHHRSWEGVQEPQ